MSIGDVVGFNHDGSQIVGVIVRLNYKTVTMLTKDDHSWRVAYNYLFKVIDADIVQQFNPKQIVHCSHNENDELEI